ncbi:hypothetical protein MERGE_002908 [Pneumocystis wakefieldiae]|uniref:Peripheral subunit-binding (PSBD) domain-containing protein n=1 Tax=Pneumocystis wakefieldiae TaxID=38082 RepID=A0A899FZ58_9ASCO|nr:hypothetical protein MERGE_002908 [Pneumocystis wakefieldiae]
MVSFFSRFFRQFFDKDSLKIIQTKGNNILLKTWYHKSLFSPEKTYKSSKKSSNTFFKNVFNMYKYMYIGNQMNKFQFQKKRCIFTGKINRNAVLEKDISKDGLKNTATISSPAVLSLIKHYNITNPYEIKTTGPQGRLLKGDILAHVGAINKDFPLKLLKIIKEKGKLDLNNLKVKPKQPTENSFISIIIPVSLKSLLSMKESINEKLNIKVELSDLINKAIYKGSQKKKFQNIIIDKRTNVLWESPKTICMENIIFPSSISLSLEEILEAPEQDLKKSKEDLDIIDFLAGNLSDKSSILTIKKFPYYTTFIRIKLDKSYTDINVAKSFIKELKNYIETPETLLL